MRDTELSYRSLRQGLARLNAGRIGEAASLIQQAIRQDGMNTHAWLALSMVGFRAGNPGISEFALRRLLILTPGSGEPWSNLGTLLHDRDWWENAVDCYRRAIAIDPGEPVQHYNLGNSLALLNQDQPARRAYRRALALAPRHTDTLYHLSVLEIQLGLPRDAERTAGHGLVIQPRTGKLIGTLTSAHKAWPGDPLIARLQGYLRDPDLPVTERRHIHFGLADMLVQIGETEAAFPHYVEGHKARAEDLGHSLDIASIRSFLAGVRKLIDRRAIETMAPLPSPDPSMPRPIFIVGMPRSGTSLTEQILSGHSQVFPGGELSGMGNILAKICPSPDEAGLRQALRTLTVENRVVARNAYLDLLKTLRPDKPYVTDKMPTNFSHVWLMRVLFPDAPIIHCLRDPMDNCYSCFTIDFWKGHEFTDDLTSLGAYYRFHAEIMAHWMAVVPDPPLPFHNETLIAEPEPQVRRLLGHCGLAFEAGCLDFGHNRDRAVKTASALQVKDGLTARSIGKWRRHAAQLGPLRDALGDLVSSD